MSKRGDSEPMSGLAMVDLVREGQILGILKANVARICLNIERERIQA